MINLKLKPLFICNYETIRRCKYYDGYDMNKLCPYLSFKEKTFSWHNLKNNIIIFDEAHFCKTKSTLNGRLLISR